MHLAKTTTRWIPVAVVKRLKRIFLHNFMLLNCGSNFRSNWSPKSTPPIVSLYLCTTLGAVTTIPRLFNFLTVLLNGRKTDLIIKLNSLRLKSLKIENQILARRSFSDFYLLHYRLHYFQAGCIVSDTQFYRTEEPRL